MKRALFLISVSVLFALPASAALHIWRGTADDRFSNAANWEGGSPANDAEAELSFPSATRMAVTNDLPALTVRSMAISGAGYVFSGNAISFAPGNSVLEDHARGTTIFHCALVLGGRLTVSRSTFFADTTYLTFNGPIGGTGDLTKTGTGNVMFAGAAPNTYAGRTIVRSGELQLAKPAGVNAVPGDLTIESGSTGENAFVRTARDEQIPDSATVTVRNHGRVYIGATESVGPLRLGNAHFQMAFELSGLLVTTGNLILKGDVIVDEAVSQLAFFAGRVTLSGMRTFTFLGSDSQLTTRISGLFGTGPGDGLVVRGIVDWFEVEGRYTGPTLVEGGLLRRVANTTSAVTVRGGRFAGTAASIDVESGVLEGGESASFLRLTPAATAKLAIETGKIALIANGPVDLGGASADFTLPFTRQLGVVHTIVQNRSASATAGTFAGLPEGGVLADRVRISYLGGDGNDVTLTEVGRHATSTTLTFGPLTVDAGQSANLTATVAAAPGSSIPVTGDVTFFDGTTALGTVALDGARQARLTVTLGPGQHVLTARYLGTAEVAPSEATATARLAVRYPKPVIQSVDPSTFPGGTTVDLVIRGTGFVDGARIVLGNQVFPATFVSATELRARVRQPQASADANVLMVVEIPFTCCASFSDPFTVRVTAPPSEPSPLVFETRQVSAPVDPGADSAWFAHSARNTLHRTFMRILPDADGDGMARLALEQDLLPQGIWTVTDLRTGRFMTGSPAGPLPPQHPQEKMFLRDPAGNYSHVIVGFGLVWDFFWARPGVGAWTARLTDGGAGDLDGVENVQIVFNTSRFAPVDGSPARPDGVQRGDVFVAIPAFDVSGWLGMKIDGQLEEAGGTGTLSLVPHVAVVTRSGISEAARVARVTVLRREGTEGAVSVRYRTQDGTAVAGVQYQAVSGTLEFGPGEILKTIEIPIIDDTFYRGDSRFEVVLSDPAGAPIAGPASMAVDILENDPIPVVRFGKDYVYEGHTGTQNVVLPVTLTAPAAVPVTVQWSYGSIPGGTLTFLPGETRKSVTIPVLGNERPEPDTVITVYATSVQNAQSAQGSLTVIDDDYAQITISDVTVDESASVAEVGVTRSASGRPVTIRYTTVAGSATPGADFTPKTGTLTMNTSSLRALISIPLLNDTIGESPEWFTVVLTEVSGAQIQRGTGVVSILDDEPPTAAPVPVIRDVGVVEGDAGTTNLQLRVALSKPAIAPVTVTYATANGTATAGTDYVAANGTVTFAIGEQEKTVPIAIAGDTLVEPGETFTVRLDSPLGTTTAVVTIVNDDGEKRRSARR
jgi:autotransporter-associated beta strand protein